MRKFVIVLLVLALTALPLVALADNELVVIGTATVTVQPDIAELSVGVETHAGTVSAAVEGNAEALNAVMEALQAAGVAEGDLSTSNYYVGMDYSYDTSPATVVGYYVSNMLNVIVRDVTQIGAVIDAATAAGANQVYGVNFRSSQQGDGYDRALTLAIQEGMRKAQLIAIAGGRALGPLERIEESGIQSYGVKVAFDMAARASGTSIVPEELSVTASVVMTYELR